MDTIPILTTLDKNYLPQLQVLLCSLHVNNPADSFSLCFFGGEKMQELKYLGTASGRDEDKIAKSGLTLTHIDGVPCFEEATTVLLCRKMYVQTLREDCFTDRAVMESSYPQRDFHDVYVAEIMKVLVK